MPIEQATSGLDDCVSSGDAAALLVEAYHALADFQAQTASAMRKKRDLATDRVDPPRRRHACQPPCRRGGRERCDRHAFPIRPEPPSALLPKGATRAGTAFDPLDLAEVARHRS